MNKVYKRTLSSIKPLRKCKHLALAFKSAIAFNMKLKDSMGFHPFAHSSTSLSST